LKCTGDQERIQVEYRVTILIAEDNASLARSIARCLRQSGFEAEIAGTAAATSLALHNDNVSALCLDLQLPDGDGLDLLENVVRPLHPCLPVVIVTGHGTHVDRMRAEMSGALAFLIKPFQLSELKSILECALCDSAPADMVVGEQAIIGQCGRRS
jgi:DNA-binding response OmpR family regulator